MNRFILLLISLALAICSIPAIAAEPSYSVTADATRLPKGDQIVIKLKLIDNFAVANGNALATRASPILLVSDGETAQLVIASAESIPATAPAYRRAGTTAPVRKPEIESGFKFDVISIKGQNKMLIVVSVIEKGVTIWAEAQNVQVAAANRAP